MMSWKGVLPAITTCFDGKLNLDHRFLAEHAQSLIAGGCSGIIALGSLGEAATLTDEEKLAILRTLAQTLGDSAPLAAGVSALGTREAVELAKAAAAAGCRGLMVLPPYVYRGDWREMKAHVSAIIGTTPLSCMLYNNPVAYGTDFLPEQVAELAAEHKNLHAVKESSTDARRVSAIRALCGDRLTILVGVDDCVIEGVAMGAEGWVGGLCNAMPEEAVALFQAARDGNRARAEELNAWLLPLLRMDTVPKFVQLIKLMQQEAGMGNARVRPPRLELEGAELESARAAIQLVLNSRSEYMRQAPRGTPATPARRGGRSVATPVTGSQA